MFTVQSEHDLSVLLGANTAIIFVGFDWSSQAALSSALVLEWERIWSTATRAKPIAIHAAYPDRQPWFAVWLATASAQSGLELAGGGHGSLIWLANGRIVAFEPFAAGAGIRQLGATTDQAFPACVGA
jgi:hypothetical protein